MEAFNELKKDKYLLLLLCVLLLLTYMHTKDAVVETLLVTCVGGFLGLVRTSAAPSPQVTTDSGNVQVTQPAETGKS